MCPVAALISTDPTNGPHTAGVPFKFDASPKIGAFSSTIIHSFTALNSLTSEDCATLPKATKVRRIVTGQASGFTRQLITEHRVSQDLYSRAAATFGTAELVNMTFLIGHYLLTSAVLNTFETPAPDQQADITKKG